MDYLDSLMVASLPCVCVVVICLFSSLIAAVTKRERLKSKWGALCLSTFTSDARSINHPCEFVLSSTLDTLSFFLIGSNVTL